MAKLKVGDPAWWRGMRMVVTDVYGTTYTHETVDARVPDPEWKARDGETEGRTMPAYICTSNIADAKWDEEYGFWYLPGALTGTLPEVHITAEGVAEYEDPPIPTCICEEALGHEHGDVCGAITFMAGPRCNTCRVADARAAVGVA